MPKHAFRVGAQAATAEFTGGGIYDGPVPPAAIYNVTLKKLRIKVNKNSDDMLNALLEINETGEKKQYNGYGVWDNLNVTDQGAPYINTLLDAIGAPRKTFWDSGVVKDTADPPNVLKVGTKTVDDNPLRIATTVDHYGGNTRLVVSRYLPVKPDVDAADDEPADTTAIDEPVAEEAAVAVEAEPGSEPVSDEELNEMELADLKELADLWGVEYTPKATKKTMVALLSAAQEPEEAPAEEAEPEPDASGALTEDEMKEMEVGELKELLTDTYGKELPKPPIRTRLIKAILAAQEEASSEPPF